MKNLLNPKWLLIVNTLPLTIMALLFYSEFSIIKSLLSDKSLIYWINFGIGLFCLLTLTAVYAVILIFTKKQVSYYYAFFAGFLHSVFLYLFYFNIENIISSDIPRWMLHSGIEFYALTFFMPTLAYSLILIVNMFTSKDKDYKAYISLLISISIPLGIYLFGQFITPLLSNVQFPDSKYFMHFMAVSFIVISMVFFFFLIRFIYILYLRKGVNFTKYELAWKVPFALILPVLGLAVNNGLIIHHLDGVFGDFSNYWFYVLAILNGIVLCIKNVENVKIRSLLFILRSILFVYTLYFFVVFLPFLPFSIVAIVALGLGFLIIAPVVLMIIHVIGLYQDFIFLRNYFSKILINAVFLISFSVIPIVITMVFIKDKAVLNETLDYVYKPDYSKKYSIDTVSLKNTLETIKKLKSKDNDFLISKQIPYISTYFNWLVLDNLTLSDSKIEKIEMIFFDDCYFDEAENRNPSESVHLTDYKVRSQYDAEQKAWKSWVDLELTNFDTNFSQAEFVTTINLPPACWISDYYLNIEGRKEMGILAEKKAAMWVYSQIRNYRRDPGILYYLTGNRVAFRVFPFTQGEVRTTGIEFLHKDPVSINIEGKTILLGDSTKGENPKIQYLANKGAVYIPAKEKSKLPIVQRKPYFHFIVDASFSRINPRNDYKNRIEKLLSQNKINPENAKISFVNTYYSDTLFSKNWKSQIENAEYKGGFFLDRAIKTILISSKKKPSNTYPVIVVVSNSFLSSYFENDFADFSSAIPECKYFYELDTLGSLIPHSFDKNPRDAVKDTNSLVFDKQVYAFPTSSKAEVFLPMDQNPALVFLNENITNTDDVVKQKDWNSAVLMQFKWNSQLINPSTSDKSWVNLVKNSFESKIMLPVTSYISVENEAQKAILLKKQSQVLNANRALDVGEETMDMAEPDAIIIGAIFLLILGVLYRRRNSLKK